MGDVLYIYSRVDFFREFLLLLNDEQVKNYDKALARINCMRKMLLFLDRDFAHFQGSLLNIYEQKLLRKCDHNNNATATENRPAARYINNSTNSPIIFIENFNGNGLSVKELFADCLEKLDYDCVALGKPMRGCSYWKHEVTYNNETLYSTTKNLSASYIEHQCLGTLRREFPNLIEEKGKDHKEVRNALACLVERYAKIYCTVLDAINEHNACVSFGLVWGGYLLESRAVRDALENATIPVFATEYSFDNSRVYFDSSGIIGNRHLFAQLTADDLKPLSTHESQNIEQWIRRCSHYKSGQPISNSRPATEYISSTKQNVLLLCQCNVDTVITYDCPRYPDVFSAYKEVFQSVERMGTVNLIVKLHPGDLEVNKTHIASLAEKCGIHNVVGLAENCSVYDLIKVSDCGICINSQAGLEMLAHGKNVLTLGNSFYSDAGLGLNLRDFGNLEQALTNLIASPLSDAERSTIQRYVYRFLFNYLAPHDYTQLTRYLELRLKPKWRVIEKGRRLLIVHPSGCSGGSGFYLQELAEKLLSLGWEVLVGSEGTARKYIAGVEWFRLRFDGARLSERIIRRITEFSPTHILQVGVRTKAMRAALEAYAVAPYAQLIVQAEDDEESAFLKHYPSPNLDLLHVLDKPQISKKLLIDFVKALDLEETLRIAESADHNRWVEPVLRVLCYKIATAHCCIWHPMAERLQNKFGKPTFILPPIVDFSYYEKVQVTNEERATLLREYKIAKDSHILFLSGNIYDFSNEFGIFIEGVVLAASQSHQEITLVIAGRSRNASLIEYARNRMRGLAYFRSLNIPDDEKYNRMLAVSDVVCAPGNNDIFNKYRLAGRLVKAIAMKKAILTYKTGFAEKLKTEYHGFFSERDTPESWANLILKTTDQNLRRQVGENLYDELRNQLDSRQVAKGFSDRFSSALVSDLNSVGFQIREQPELPVVTRPESVF